MDYPLEIIWDVGTVVQYVICIWIMNSLLNVKWNRKTGLAILSWGSLNFLILYFADQLGSGWSILGNFLELLGYFLYIKIVNYQKFKDVFVIILIAQILNMVGAVFASILMYTIDILLPDDIYNIWLLLFGYLFRLWLLYPLHIMNKKLQLSDLIKKKRSQYIIIIFGILFHVIRLIIRTDIGYMDNPIPTIVSTILIIVTFFGTLWIIDWYFSERERKQLWEDNNRMSQRLHKSKEIIPALNSALDRLKLDRGSDELQDILEEIHQLCKEQMGENRILDRQCKTFPPTGVLLLDEQIQLYEKEAAERNINFDVFVGGPVKEMLREKKIRELDFLQLIGDLMRNAFRAIDRDGKDQGNILLVMGCIGDTLQVDIYDDGVPFPMFILNEFGKRGNTVGGTGNGISDMMEVLERYRATFRITEYQENNTYTKGISIIWDEENGRWLDSYRSAELDEGSLLLPEKL